MRIIATSSYHNIIKKAEYRIEAPIDRDVWRERPGLEGPFRTNTNMIVYYDPREGKYYDPSKDMYIDNDEAHSLFTFNPPPIQ